MLMELQHLKVNEAYRGVSASLLFRSFLTLIRSEYHSLTAERGVLTTVERDNKAAKMMLRITIWRDLEDGSSGLLIGGGGRTDDIAIWEFPR